MLLTKERIRISIFLILVDFIKILKNYKYAVFSFSYIVADCCCSYKRLLPAAAAPTYARTVVAFLVGDMEAEGKEEESHSCNGNIAVGTVLQ